MGLLKCLTRNENGGVLGNDALTFFQNLSKRSFTCWERGTIQTSYPLWSTVRFLVSYYDRTAPNIEGAPLSVFCDVMGRSAG